MADMNKEATEGDIRWNSLQGIGILLLVSCILLCIEFLTCWLFYNENRPSSFGVSNQDAKIIVAIYSPVILVTFSALRDSLDKMIVAFQGRKVEWVVFSHRAGAIFHYSLAILGSLAPMLALLLLSLHKSTVSPDVLVGIAASIWSVTSGNFIKKYLEPYTVTLPTTGTSQSGASGA